MMTKKVMTIITYVQEESGFRLAKFKGDPYKNHPFFKFISHAHGREFI